MGDEDEDEVAVMLEDIHLLFTLSKENRHLNRQYWGIQKAGHCGVCF